MPVANWHVLEVPSKTCNTFVPVKLFSKYALVTPELSAQVTEKLLYCVGEYSCTVSDTLFEYCGANRSVTFA